MGNYKIITDEAKLDEFLTLLPDTTPEEVYYICAFGRHKYCADFPNTKDSGQLARVIARKSELKEKIHKLEVPLGTYIRNGVAAPQEAIAIYIGLNPRNLPKANRNLLVELAKRIAAGELNFNPISVATTEVHRATNRKIFVDFDYDDVDPKDYIPKIKDILPGEAFKVLRTRGGFHLIVLLEKVKHLKNNWYQGLAQLANCDIKGANTLTPIPGCTQGGFTPFFIY